MKDVSKIQKNIRDAGLCTAGLCAAGALVLFAVLDLFVLPFPKLDAFKKRDWSTRVYDRRGTLVQVLALENGVRREFTPLSAIPHQAVDIFLAAEDKRFFSHCGVDFSAVVRAALQNIRSGQRVSGASTVTMQLARLVVPAKKRNFAAKLNEARNALRIERRLSKNEILELYLNTLPFGFQTEGITSAAKTFFASPLEELSAEQLCCLAVISRRPSGNNPLEHPHVCAERAYELYRSLPGPAAGGYFAAGGGNGRSPKTDMNLPSDTLGADAADSGNGASIDSAPLEHFVCVAEKAKRAEYPFYLPHCVDFVKKRYARAELPLPAEWHLTADALFSFQAENLLANELEHNSHARVYNGAVFAIENETGNVIIWVGSNSYFDRDHQGQMDGVTAMNQSGSSSKPFLYALALDKGYKPSDVLPDIPLRFGSDEVYIPRNFNNRYNGPVRFRTALASSLNVPAVSLLDSIGEAAYADTLDKLHFDSIRTKGLDAGLALALGSAPVSLYELVRAFSVFPRDGTVIPLRLLEKSAYAGASLRSADSQSDGMGTSPTAANDDFSPSRVYSPDSARIICSILSDSEARVKGFGFSSVFKTDFPSIFKTGTANQYQSLVALCASSAYTVGVWLGNFSGETVIGKTGSSIPAYIAKEVLTRLQTSADGNGKILPARNFAEPEHWHKGRVCALSGMIASLDCPNTISEYLPDSLTAEDKKKLRCTWHTKENGRLKTVYPEEYRNWFLSAERYGAVNAGGAPLAIVRPVSGSRFLYDSAYKNIAVVPLEINGGHGDTVRVFLDGAEYAVLERPFFINLSAGKGKHTVRAVCANEEQTVVFTVE
ncbi:transglycosylase domain-containing protein [Treponema parvum]|uniref:transglycosylase domain-containing protein n=1 Tax=Treponema parvum TaxID=138851 RepID=UPI001AEC5B7A|nr:transglycosylase domain-containing protein [Treponema parvum]QTQ16509.1 transglycosylase domain-containing protein [Treponema parvum]